MILSLGSADIFIESDSLSPAAKPIFERINLSV
jgi:hypothetical protein